jgi:hypothetical protein
MPAPPHPRHPVPLSFCYFPNRVSLYAQVHLDLDFAIYSAHVAGMTGMYHYAQLIG